MNHKITKKHLKTFNKCVHFYLTNFSLKDWEVEVEVGEDETTTRAECFTSLEDKYCKIKIDPRWDVEPTPVELNKTAFHEVMELLLSPLYSLAKDRFITEKQISEAGHSIIMRLQNLLLD